MMEIMEEVVLTIAGDSYTQKQAATIAFNLFYLSGGTLDAGLLSWQNLTSKEFTMKDYAFLLLFYIDKLATEEEKSLVKIERIKEAIQGEEVVMRGSSIRGSP